MQLDEVEYSNVGGLITACINREQLVNVMVTRVAEYKDVKSKYFGKNLSIYSTNGHSISIANSDPYMKELLNRADLLHADGQSVVTFSKWFSKTQIPERSATTDTIHDVPSFYNGSLRHFLLGASDETINECAEIMSRRYSNFEIAGVNHGYFSESDVEDVIAKINSSNADVLWVGLGKPKEQQFIENYKERFKVPVIISCGGCYNFVTGSYKRAPQWMQSIGLEWLHRALTQPKKLIWRYLTTNPHAIYCAFKYRNM